MRFAYIDSQGKEVGIPSVESLQLRIELGAIVASTMFFDGSSDRWAPAGEHEIFRTLQRELADQGSPAFVAPPSKPDAPADPVATADTDLLEFEIAAPSEEPGPDFSEALGGVLALDPDLILPEERIEERTGDGGAEGFTLLPVEPPELPPPHGEPFGESEAGLATAEPPLPGRDDGYEPFERGLGGFELRPDPSELAAPAADLQLESRLADQGGDGASAWAAPLEVEPRLSDYPPEGPPGWAHEEPAPPPEPDPREERAARRARAETEADGSARPSRSAPPRPTSGREPQSRPRSAPRSNPRQSRRSLPVGLIAGIVVAALLGGGGWFGWSLMQGRGVEAEAPAYPTVEIPSIPAELEPTFRELADASLGDWTARLSNEYAAAGLANDPPMDWLAGQYLANASRYPEVERYWRTFGEAVVALRAREEQVFQAAFQQRLSDAGVTGADAELLTARALAGFQSALPDRDRVWAQLEAVPTASLGLHAFLLENEDEVDYEPAAGGLSRDPVLEAVPATRALGDEMWRRVDGITSALEDLDALSGGVSTERLFAMAMERLGRTPVH